MAQLSGQAFERDPTQPCQMSKEPIHFVLITQRATCVGGLEFSDASTQPLVCLRMLKRGLIGHVVTNEVHPLRTHSVLDSQNGTGSATARE